MFSQLKPPASSRGSIPVNTIFLMTIMTLKLALVHVSKQLTNHQMTTTYESSDDVDKTLSIHRCTTLVSVNINIYKDIINIKIYPTGYKTHTKV